MLLLSIKDNQGHPHECEHTAEQSAARLVEHFAGLTSHTRPARVL